MNEPQKPREKGWWNEGYDDEFDVDMPDSSNDPYVIEKTAAVIALLERVGLPKDWDERFGAKSKKQ